MSTTFSPADVSHIAKLANIPVSPGEQKELARGFTKTIGVIEKLQTLDVSNVAKRHMTGLANVMREDVVDQRRMFSQKQALANAANTNNGYIIVNQVIQQEE